MRRHDCIRILLCHLVGGLKPACTRINIVVTIECDNIKGRQQYNTRNLRGRYINRAKGVYKLQRPQTVPLHQHISVTSCPNYLEPSLEVPDAILESLCDA